MANWSCNEKLYRIFQIACSFLKMVGKKGVVLMCRHSRIPDCDCPYAQTSIIGTIHNFCWSQTCPNILARIYWIVHYEDTGSWQKPGCRNVTRTGTIQRPSSLTCIFLPQVGHWYTELPRPSVHTRIIGALSWLLSQKGFSNAAMVSPVRYRGVFVMRI